MIKGKIKTMISVIAAMGLLCTFPNGSVINSNAASDVTTESYTWQNVEIGGGGYVVNVIFNETEKDLIYARTDMGGAYRFNPETQRWIPLTDMIGFDDWNNLGCDSMATDPVDTNRVYIAAGTYTNNWTDANGCILRSTDKGETWETTELPFKVGANMMGRSMGERLAIDPNSNNILYMGTRSGNGLWKSTDYGVTWNQVSSFTEVGDFAPTNDNSSSYDDTLTGVVWVTFDSSTGKSGSPSQTIYVGVANKAAEGEEAENTVFCSKDGGETWNAVAGQPKDGYLPHHGVLSSDGILYVTYSNGAGPYDGTKGDVWKYDTNTGIWTQISPVSSSSEDNYFGYGGISVDAQNPDTLLVTTLNSWWPDANIYRSTDGGTTWTSLWEWNGYPTRTLRYTQDISATPWLTFGIEAVPPEPSPKLGWMIGNISIDPFNSDRMFYSTGATIYSADNLTDWDNGGKVNLTVKTLGIEQTAVLSLISPTTGTAHLVSGLGDVTGFVHEDLTKVPDMMMIRPYFSSTTGMDYAELTPNKYVRVGNTDSGTNTRIGISYDTAKNWFSGSNCWSSSSTDSTGGGNVAMSADGDTIVWAPTNQTPCYSTNNASSWTSCKGLPNNAVVASDRANSNKFYAVSGGSFYVSTDGGATFTTTATILSASNAGTLHLKAMPGIEGDIWVAGGHNDAEYGLWHSTDSGKTFTKLSNVEKADVVGFGKAAPGKDYMALYVSAQINGVRGIFRSDDVGETWVRINDDQHQYGSTNSSITGDPRVYGRVYVGTNGRGIVYGDTNEETVIPDPDPTPEVNSATLSPAIAAFDKNIDKQEDITVTIELNGNTLNAIKNGSTTLVKDTDYTFEDNTVIIKKEYLTQLATGATSLIFEFNAGDNAILKVNISDSTSTSTPVVQGDLEIQMFNNNTNDSTVSIAPQFKIINNGSDSIKLSDLKLRYYFTKENASDQNFWCDWSNVDCTNVIGKFVTMEEPTETADCYLEISFLSSAGSLSSGESAVLQTRFAKSDWSNYSQSNDYSFLSSATSFTQWTQATAYISDNLQWGVEPK
ncbi:cellulose binding domain-containing protein [Lachnotalea glycerini]|uniref:Cellulose binding domain-containing protein n=1 Tax=Lachnotalea glycerini TaxID=1763509 RepID=A0A318ES83_9FIRM|nr:X2-like carbohydrate binding domain-containing protein [Lachnotalea glycerini]PXV95795.1 cellulose binding domain-containing protein [Lachnotalea glycerini]